MVYQKPLLQPFSLSSIDKRPPVLAMTSSRCSRCQDVSDRHHHRHLAAVRQPPGGVEAGLLAGVPSPALPPAPGLSLPQGHRPDHGDGALPAGRVGEPAPRPGHLSPRVPGAGELSQLPAPGGPGVTRHGQVRSLLSLISINLFNFLVMTSSGLRSSSTTWRVSPTLEKRKVRMTVLEGER